MMPVWVIQLSYGIAYCALVLAVVITVTALVLELRSRNFRWLPLYALFLAFQPAWHLLSWAELHDGDRYPRGDCGYGNRSFSLFLLGVTVALFTIVWRRRPLRRRSFVFRVVLAFTFLNIIDLLYHSTPLSAITPQRVWFYEVYASIFSGIGGRPRDTLVLLLICALFYFVQRLRLQKAV